MNPAIQKACKCPLYEEAKHTRIKTYKINTYKILNNNQNFVPTTKKYPKIESNLDIQGFFCLIKLKAHFKEKETTASSDLNIIEPFKIKNKQK